MIIIMIVIIIIPVILSISFVPSATSESTCDLSTPA